MKLPVFKETDNPGKGIFKGSLLFFAFFFGFLFYFLVFETVDFCRHFSWVENLEQR